MRVRDHTEAKYRTRFRTIEMRDDFYGHPIAPGGSRAGLATEKTKGCVDI